MSWDDTKHKLPVAILWQNLFKTFNDLCKHLNEYFSDKWTFLKTSFNCDRKAIFILNIQNMIIILYLLFRTLSLSLNKYNIKQAKFVYIFSTKMNIASNFYFFFTQQEVLLSKNTAIKDLQFELARVCKVRKKRISIPGFCLHAKNHPIRFFFVFFFFKQCLFSF